MSKRSEGKRSGVTPIVVLATALGFVLVQLDVSIVNVALATIGTDLHSAFSGLQWIVDAYTIVFAAFLLSAGSLSDRFGAKRTFAIGFAIFVLASIGCGVAPSPAVLIAMRAVQGLGAALLVPTSLALLNHASGNDAAARARAIGMWTAAGSIALAAGPIAGGALVASIGWRSIFFVNVPLGVLGLWLAFRVLDETPARAGSFDALGQVTAIGALGAGTGAVILAGDNGTPRVVVVALAALALACIAFFLRVESTRERPMLPLELFSRPAFRASSIVGLFVNFTLYGAIFVLGLYFQHTLKLSPLQTGLAFLPFCIVLGCVNVVAGHVTSALGSRVPMAFGLGVAAIGWIALVPVTDHSAYVVLLAGLVIAPAGIGFAVPAMTTAMLASVDKNLSGIASGVLNTVRQSGGALGVAVLGSLFSAHGIAGLRASFGASAALVAAAAIVAWLSVPARDRAEGAAH